MSSSILRARLRAQETQFMREQDLNSYKHIRDALEGTGELEAARKRMEETLAKEADNIDVLAEVSSARAMAKFKVEDLPVTPITIRPQRYEPNQAESDLEEFMRNVPRPQSSGMKAASQNYNEMMRGRYVTINEFMKSMEVQDEERRPMTKREMFRAQKQFQASRGSAAAIFGSFAAGTFVCVAGAAVSWFYVKNSMGVRDTKEYSDKMRQMTPMTKRSLSDGALGATVRKFKSGIESRVTGSGANLKAFEGIQKKSDGPEESR